MKELKNQIKSAKDILLVSHQDPDGDSLGSLVMLQGYCQAINQKAKTTIVADPKHRAQLDNYYKKYQIQTTTPTTYDLAIAVDVSTPERVFPQNIKININIDHHHDNSIKTELDIIDGQAASTGLIIYRHCLTEKIKLTSQMAEGLYLSISTDTGNFAFANTSAEVFEAASTAVQAGANPAEIYQQVNEMPLNEMLALAKGLSTAESFFEGKLVIGIAGEELDNRVLIDQLRRIPEVEIAVVLVQKADFIKLSLRSKDKQDVSKIAHDFKGGGHQKAAAGKIEAPDLATAKKIIVDYCARKIF